MKKISLLFITVLMTVSSALTGCSDSLEVDPPDDGPSPSEQLIAELAPGMDDILAMVDGIEGVVHPSDDALVVPLVPGAVRPPGEVPHHRCLGEPVHIVHQSAHVVLDGVQAVGEHYLLAREIPHPLGEIPFGVLLHDIDPL